MSLLAILAALGLEQWRAYSWRAGIERTWVRQAARIERAFNGGTAGHGAVAATLAIAPAVVATLGLWWALDTIHPVAGWVFNVAVLYVLMGFRRYSHAVSAIVAAFNGGDLVAARRALAGWRGGAVDALSSSDVSRLAIERGLEDSYRQVFAVIFWFVLLPGPTGAILYRAAARLAGEWVGPRTGEDSTPIAREREAFGRPARWLLAVLDWMPARLTALSFAVVGDFEDAVACWRTQAAGWPADEGAQASGTVLAAGAGALGVTLGGPIGVPGEEPIWRPEIGMGEPPEPEFLPLAVGLVWRALVLWLAVILLVTVAHLLP